jgi:hypothetical protein
MVPILADSNQRPEECPGGSARKWHCMVMSLLEEVGHGIDVHIANGMMRFCGILLIRCSVGSPHIQSFRYLHVRVGAG